LFVVCLFVCLFVRSFCVCLFVCMFGGCMSSLGSLVAVVKRIVLK
jgi:hypothetical protein